MKVYQLPHVNGNFGDALNGWLWQDLLPHVFDDDDSVHFVGIGTILDRNLPPARLTVVFGAGTGYGPPPVLHERPQGWRVYGVRGPLTARVLGLPDEAVLTDPAILLARHPAFRRRKASGRVLFVPHWKSTQFGQWREACRRADIDFVDPCEDAHAVIRRIAGARKVIAESMHAGIIADAFRVPWVPVVLSREVAPFKWADWAATLGMRYEPLLLDASSPVEVLRDQLLRRSAFGYIGRLEGKGAHGAAGTPLHWTEDELLRDHAQAVARVARPVHWQASRYAEALLKRVARAARRLHAPISPSLYERYLDRSAAQLQVLAARPGRLSGDAQHLAALERCQQALHRLAADHLSGRLHSEVAPLLH